ncbi:MAG: hypothetical protein F2545_02200 [Actinobacteria bacterium]|uniref:Unannotated protein n=1 Tax=freshwater metagenome TaxID=449393 RepID=A0A6J6CYH7_9ZZZZ|nr:hypothetical protein [Actinomycetota bacterium]
MRCVLSCTLRLVSAAAIAVVLYVCVVGVTVVGAGTMDNGREADAIVVMGAAQYDGRPSELLESRLSHALELFKNKNRAPLIAVTGGKQAGDRFTESEASAQWLIENGVDADVILQEDIGRSTWESLNELMPILNGKSVKNVIMVTSDWHVARSALTLEELGFSVSSSAIDSRGASVRRWLRETVGVATGRIIGFRNLFSITG